MYRVLIVDDERLIRVSIRQRVNWEKLGLVVAGMAGNGLEALQFIEQKRPDIVLVDIRMPLMDGLELIKEVRRRNLDNIRFVIISGYNDFVYARQAIRLGVCDYIQKPVDEEELENTLRSIISEIENESSRSGQDDGPSANRHPGHSDDIAACNAWLHGQPISGPVQLEHLQGPEYCLVLAVSSGGLKPDLALASLADAARSVFPASQQLAFADSASTTQLWLLLGGMNLKPPALAGKIQQTGGFDAAITPVFNSLSEMPRLNNLTWLNLIHRLFTSARPFVRLCQPEPPPDSRLMVTAEELTSCLEIMINEHDLKGTADLIRRILADCLLPAASPVLLDRFVTSYSAMLARAVNSCDSTRRQVVPPDVLLNAPSISSLCTTLISFASQVLGENGQSRPQDIIARVCSYIDQNYDRELTLTEIAEHFHLNASYLSQLFKIRSGKRLTEYIESVRIERSRILLETLDIPVVVAAARVGYSDANYFSKVFKKNTGLSPTQYQREAARQRQNRTGPEARG